MEYYRLLGISCSKKLRIKLDCALKISPESNEGFAQISADWNGNCSLQQEDGLCSLQTELGENSLPNVCRLYPRHTKRQKDGGACSCSNSCEAVVDILIQMHEPMQFETIELSLDPLFLAGPTTHSYNYITEAILILQDRNLPLTQRFISLSNFLFGSESYSWITNPLSIAFRILPTLMSHFETSISISEYCITSLDYLRLNGPQPLYAETTDTVMRRYLAVSDTLDELLPNWQVLFEQLIVNHMFYNHFSLTESHENLQDDFLSLITMYSFLIFNLLGNLSVINTSEQLVDYLSSMFRVIEHSNFRAVAIKLYRNNFSIDSEISVS
jgi:hypothetical protein